MHRIAKGRLVGSRRRADVHIRHSPLLFSAWYLLIISVDPRITTFHYCGSGASAPRKSLGWGSRKRTCQVRKEKKTKVQGKGARSPERRTKKHYRNDPRLRSVGTRILLWWTSKSGREVEAKAKARVQSKPIQTIQT